MGGPHFPASVPDSRTVGDTLSVSVVFNLGYCSKLPTGDDGNNHPPLLSVLKSEYPNTTESLFVVDMLHSHPQNLVAPRPVTP